MCGRLAELAEIARGTDDAFAEMMLPDAIDHDACRQRMVRPRQPAGQIEPTAAVGDRFLLTAGQNFRKAPRHQRTKPIVTTADVDANIMCARMRAAWNTAFLSAVGVGNRLFRFLVCFYLCR